jgi:hypothetical protein
MICAIPDATKSTVNLPHERTNRSPRRDGSQQRIQMNSRTLLASFLTLFFTLPLPIHARGAAESVLTNAFSSSVAVKAGPALNHALRQSNNQLGARVRERTSGPVQLVVPNQQRRMPPTELKNKNARSLTLGTAGPISSADMLISIQGGETACTPVCAMSRS